MRWMIVVWILLVGLETLLFNEVAAQIVEKKLTPRDGTEIDWFGNAVSISGDYAVVGAVLDEDFYSDASGSAYVFRREGAVWVEEAKLIASDEAPFNQFGFSVSISGDYALVGADEDDDKGSNSGSAYIVHRNGTDWVEETKLTASDGSMNDVFGWAVSISGSYGIVGAPRDDNEYGANAGSAYLFHGIGTDSVGETRLTASDGGRNDHFGVSVSISGGYALVGSYGDEGRVGSAYVFHREGDDWVEEAKLTASDASAGDFFGWGVSISGDYALVGAHRDADNGSRSGSAYIFRRVGTDWMQEAKLTAGDGARGDHFGRSVAVSGNYALIGASNKDDQGRSSGSAYLFHREGADWVEEAKLTASDASADDFFGWSVSISDDLALIGVYGDDVKGWNSGSAFVYSGFSGLHASGTSAQDEEAVFSKAEPLPGDQTPISTVLNQNYPNPFNPTTTFEFSIPHSLFAHLSVYNLLGEKVATVVDEQLPAGTHRISWDATGQPSGMYFYRLEAGGFMETRKLVLLR